MRISDNVRKCVVFLGFIGSDGLHKILGTAFFVGIPDVGSIYLVTAKHVINECRNSGATEVYFRCNTATGSCAWIESKLSQWIQHPTDPHVDVAILHTSISDDLDHLALDMSLFGSPEKISDNEVGVGDDVFITGLFTRHSGTQKNIPIVRTGTIAAMVDEPVTLSGGARIDAYLIEARSIGGLSGSPVFVNCGSSRIIKGVMRHATGATTIYFFIGLMLGYYKDSEDRANTGIAIVVPESKIIETLRQPVILEMESRIYPRRVGR